MKVDGNTIAKAILEQLKKDLQSSSVLTLTAITCAPNFETQKYLKMKKAKAASIGVELNVVELPADAATKDVIDCLNKVAPESDGVVIQLPLPEQIDRDAVLAAVTPDKDPDGFQYGKASGACLSPVVGAIDEISNHYSVEWKDKKVVVLGNGRLVGEPASYYASQKYSEVTVMIKEDFDSSVLKAADIIISGIGQPHFIKPDMVKEGVVIFDAGTSEDGGVLVGDVDPNVLAKASLLTPVPGGIGPLTIASLLRNLVNLARQ